MLSTKERALVRHCGQALNVEGMLFPKTDPNANPAAIGPDEAENPPRRAETLIPGSKLAL